MLRARKHRKVSTTEVSNQKPEAEFRQHPTASRVASQVPCEPKHPLPKWIWKPKQKSPAEASGVAMPKPRLSRKEKGKMPFRSNNAANHKIKMAIIPSPRAAMPRASFVHMGKATVPQRTHRVHGREARTKALFSANPFYRDKRNGTSSYAHSKRVSTRDYLGSDGPDLREVLANKRKSESFRTTSPCCQQNGCQLVTVHSAQCQLRPILATLPCQQLVFDRLSVRVPIKHRKRSTSRDPVSASVNMTGRGRELRRGSRTSDDTPCSSPDPDYSPGLGEVLVHEEGVFRNTRSRVAIPYSYEQPSSSMALTSSQPGDHSNHPMKEMKTVGMPLQRQ